MNQRISQRYQKALVTVAMGFRTEEDIKKNGLYKFIKQEKKELNEESMLNLINMTPLSKNYNCDKTINEITIALNIYVLKVRDKSE